MMLHLNQACLAFLLTATLLALGNRSMAQGLSPRPTPGMEPGTSPRKDTPEGPAEAAPEGEAGQADLPTVPPLWAGAENKQVQFFELHGYMRLRYDVFHKLNLGMSDVGGLKAPFYNPISENGASNLGCAARQSQQVPGGGSRSLDAGCRENTLNSANMRLRLEPTINVGELVRVHTQFDVFDNVVLGSSPDRRLENPARPTDVTLEAFANSQSSPAGTQNSPSPAIVAKRAWADVETPFGALRFGRMPNQWGLGMVANDGSCWDCNYGDNVDRVMFEANVLGYTLSMGYDIASNGPTSLTVANPQGYGFGGQAVDLETLDDVDELFWVVGKLEPEEVVRDKVDRGELVLNYGLYMTYRWQGFSYANNQGLGAGTPVETYAANFLERHMWSVMPDVWVKLMWKKLLMEFEGVLIGGSIGNASNERAVDTVSILQYGFVLRTSHKFLKDSLTVGFETGSASGDDDEPLNADVNRRRWHPLGLNGDGTRIDRNGKLNEFRFNNDYHVDLILFREILGSVANATYFKPWVQYLIVDSFGSRLDLIYSFANNPVGFPGNARSLGMEMDLDVFYQNIEEKFFAGLQYGVLFPLGALDRDPSIYGSNGFSSEVAHRLQLRMVVKF